MKFTKMQGAGNDFVVVRTRNTDRDWSKRAVEMCDRHFGIGADGLLLLLPSSVADFKMRLFNADGSESRACGNGMRCLVKLYLDENSGDNNDCEVTIETLSGIRTAKVHHRQAKIIDIQANMGRPMVGHNGTVAQVVIGNNQLSSIESMMNRLIGINGQKIQVSLVTVGNPHAVHFCRESVASYPLSNVGPLVEQHGLFPDETNFEIVRVINRNKVEARVWERGCGETCACGTGACAITVAGKLLGYLDEKVEVELPGGTLTVEWDGEGEVYLGGPAATVFQGEWS